MPVQEVQTVTKDTHKLVLKALCELPTLNPEELFPILKNKQNKITLEEIIQVVHSLSPNINWHRAGRDEIQKEILNYIWTLEAQILFLFPTKLKDTTIADFNQLRLQNNHTKVSKDIIKHVQGLLSVDGKNLNKFRKLQKDFSYQEDIDVKIQADWACRILLSSLQTEPVTDLHLLSGSLIDGFRQKFSVISEKAGSQLQRICEKFVEKYIPKNFSGQELKNLILSYQNIYNSYKNLAEGDVLNQPDKLKDQNKLVEDVIDSLRKIQEMVKESHEGGFISKLFTGQLKNREGIIKRINEVISFVNQISTLSEKANKVISDKTLLVQKLQSDYEGVLLVKSQLERDLHTLSEKLGSLEEVQSELDKASSTKSEQLGKQNEKVILLQNRVNEIPELESRMNLLREELTCAKNISLGLYSRLLRLKSDLFKQYSDKAKITKQNNESKINNGNKTVHKFQYNEDTGEAVLTTEVADSTTM